MPFERSTYHHGARRPAVSFLPSTAILELTYQCNHRCVFCSCPWGVTGGKGETVSELTTEEWKSAIKKLCEKGVSNITFSGGDPLLRQDLMELISYSSSCSVEHIDTLDGALVSRYDSPNLYIITNGRDVDDQFMQVCKRHNVKLGISLPGLETFLNHTGHDGAEKVLEVLSQAKNLGLGTVANITVTKLNIHELERIIASALLAGAGQILLNRFLPGGQGLAHKEELILSPDQVAEMVNVGEAVLRAANRFGSLGTIVPACLVNPGSYENLTVSTECSAATKFFTVGPSGYVRVCNHSSEDLAHIDRIQDLKRSEHWKAFSLKGYLPEGCGGCPDKISCDGGCPEVGDDSARYASSKYRQ